jgi:DNA-binding IclR family transcriptional regulator
VLGRERALTAMLSIQGPASRLPARRMPGLASLLREAADAVGVALGGSR